MKSFLGVFSILFLMSSSGYTHQSQSQSHQPQAYQDGQSFGVSAMNGVKSAATSTHLHTLPRFQTDKPKEAFLNERTLGDAALTTSKTDEAAQYLYIQNQERETFKIDPSTDPLFAEAKAAVLNPQKTLEEEIVSLPASEGREELRTCEESGEETFAAAEEWRTLIVPNTKHRLQVNIYSHGWSGGLSRNVVTGAKLDGSTSHTTGYAASTTLYNPLPQELQGRVIRVSYAPEFSPPWYLGLSEKGVLSVTTSSGGSWFHIANLSVDINVTYKPTDAQISETIQSNAQHLEEKVEQGLCVYDSLIILEGPETRIINHYPAKRDWWRRKLIYRCHYPSLNTCEALRRKGCYQIQSTCKERVGSTCVVWQQTYRCPSGKKSSASYHSSNKNSPFCLTGNCADTSYEANTEMMNAMSHLYALREIQNNLREFNIIFKGTHRWCTRNLWNFKDCCGGHKGWGVTLHLSSCDAAEIKLRALRDKNLCVLVGTYCAEKNLGRCTRKKTSFCCYGSKVARLIQQSGRAQLGIGWGTPKNPACERGFSPEELSRINFSTIDFSELFADIQSKTVVKNQGQSLGKLSTTRLQENMTTLTKPSSDSAVNQKKQDLKKKGF